MHDFYGCRGGEVMSLQAIGIKGVADEKCSQIATVSLGRNCTVENLMGMLGLSPSIYTVSFTGQVIM